MRTVSATVAVTLLFVSAAMAGENLRSLSSKILSAGIPYPLVGDSEFDTCVDACYQYEIRNKEYHKTLCGLDWVNSGMKLKFWRHGTGFGNCLHEGKADARERMIKQLRACETKFKKAVCPDPGPKPHPDRCVRQCVDWELKNTDYRRLNNWAMSGMDLKFWRRGTGFGDCLQNSREKLIEMVNECERTFKAQAC